MEWVGVYFFAWRRHGVWGLVPIVAAIVVIAYAGRHGMPPADAGLVFAVFSLVGAAAMVVQYRWLRWRIVTTVRRQQASGEPIFYKQPGSLFFIPLRYVPFLHLGLAALGVVAWLGDH
jgi:hypothetical protein